MHTKVLRGLRIRDAPLLDQSHRLKLELRRKPSPLNGLISGPIKTPNSVSSEPGAGQYRIHGARTVYARKSRRCGGCRSTTRCPRQPNRVHKLSLLVNLEMSL